MPREVTERMLWLAPPVLFTLGTGISKPMFHEGFGRRPDASLFLDARVGYPRSPEITFGVGARGSRLALELLDSADDPHTFDGYTLELGGFAEAEANGRFVGMIWVGMHAARMTYRMEPLFTGPVLAGGLTLGCNVYASGRYRVTLFGEAQMSRTVALPAGFAYDHAPLSLGVAVRF